MKEWGEVIVAGVVISLVSTVVWREVETGFWRTKHYYGRITHRIKKIVKREVPNHA